MVTEETLKKSNALLLALHAGKTLLFNSNVYGEFTVHMNPQRNRYFITALDEIAKKAVKPLVFRSVDSDVYNGSMSLLSWPVALEIIMDQYGKVRCIGFGEVELDDKVVQETEVITTSISIIDTLDQAKLDRIIDLRDEVSKLIKSVNKLIPENK